MPLLLEAIRTFDFLGEIKYNYVVMLSNIIKKQLKFIFKSLQYSFE